MLVHQHLLGEAAEVGELADRRAVVGEARIGAGRARADRRGADGRLAAQAVLAGAAELDQEGDHVVAGADVGHVRAHRFDHARRLMARHDDRPPGHRGRVDGVQVAVAEAGADGADQHLARRRLVDGQLDDVERARRLQDRGLHGGFLRFLCFGFVALARAPYRAT